MAFNYVYKYENFINHYVAMNNFKSENCIVFTGN